jgi:2-dehydro-3-deoxy-D-arabinonate dehydratase
MAMAAYRLYKTTAGPIVERAGEYYRIDRPWDELCNDDALSASLETFCSVARALPDAVADIASPLAPIGRQEVWACGVTYLRSRVARMEEARESGGGDFYDRVYDAERPELFFKATADRVVGPGTAMHLRSDSRWIVPEPELTLAVTAGGTVVGWTIGNDLSCRDIEGENPLYLPQAKTFDRCAALGPCLLIAAEPPGPDTRICVSIRRGDTVISTDSTTLGQMKRRPPELVDWLYRDNAHAHGCFLMTGTGIVPADDVSLIRGDLVDITIDGIGLLSNPMD